LQPQLRAGRTKEADRHSRIVLTHRLDEIKAERNGSQSLNTFLLAEMPGISSSRTNSYYDSEMGRRNGGGDESERPEGKREREREREREGRRVDGKELG